MRNDESTIATLETLGTESFADVRGGSPLSMTASPRFDTIGLDAKNTNPSLLSGGSTETLTTTEICFSLQAGELPDSEEARAPVDVIVALDRSGSMTFGKLDLCKKTLGILLRQLLPQDRFGLITYCDQASIAVPIQRMTLEHKAAASKAIAAVQAMGGTNISSAVGLCAQEMRTIDSPNPVQTVFFLTDGHANSGICSIDGLAKLVKNCYSNPPTLTPTVEVDTGFFHTMSLQHQKQQAQAQVPAEKEEAKKPAARPVPAISLHTFGYGADHNGALLREMAEASEGGSYYFIEEDKDVGGAFGDALGGVLSVVAQNATLTLDVPVAAKAMGVAIQKVHHDKAIRRENGSYTVTMGDFFAEETRDLVVTVVLATPHQPTKPEEPIPHVFASLSYTDTIESRLVQTETVVVSIARPKGGQLSEENPYVATQCFRVYATKEMEEAAKLATAGQFPQAQAVFYSMQTVYAKCSPLVQASPVTAGLYADACEMQTTMSDTRNYASKGQATLNAKMYSHKAQRSTEAPTADPRAAAGKAYKRAKKRDAYSSAFSIH